MDPAQIRYAVAMRPVRSTMSACSLSLTLAGCGDPLPMAGDESTSTTADASSSTGDVPTTSSADTTSEAPSTSTGDDELPEPAGTPAAAPLLQWVDPFIGTGGKGYGTGSAFPGPQVPFGLARPGPDTGLVGGTAVSFAHCSGYNFEDSVVLGFSQTRMHGTGIVDYGQVSFMPTLGFTPAKAAPKGVMQSFLKTDEQASPGYYRVKLADGVDVELTATDRVGLHRFSFPAGQPAAVVMDLGRTLPDVDVVSADFTVDPGGAGVTGSMKIAGGYSNRAGGVEIHFAARFSRPFVGHGAWQGEEIVADDTARDGLAIGAYFEFDGDDPVVLAVGLSFVDPEHAAMNLAAEAADLDFDAARAAAESRWEDLLARVHVWGDRERDFTMFYTALYHTLMMPTLATDVDGSYRGLDLAVHSADGFTYYTDLSLWDTFRTLHPLLTLLYPEHQTDFLRSLTAMAQDGGFMPRWPLGTGYTDGMVGESATVVFADSIIKGIDPAAAGLADAYAAMKKTAMAPVPPNSPYGGRAGVLDYIELGYVPIEAGGSSVSWTLESAYNDHALATIAAALGETEDAAMFATRARNYKNTWDPATGLMIGRHKDGTFVADVDPLTWQDFYAEGNALQYTWYAPHDLEGLAELMGGRDVTLGRLTELFENSESEPVGIMPQKYYWHGNEPDLHYAYIFSALDQPAGSARWSRWILNKRYRDDAAGLPGNDDAGTMSAWLVFASAGIFPIAGTDTYLLGSPRFTRTTFHLPGGDLVLDAPAASEKNLYIDAAALDGEPLTRARLTHDQLASGAELRLDMTETPGPWGQVP
jgi:predicted alpha-1,2-mannosidase